VQVGTPGCSYRPMEACVGQQLGLRDPDQPRIQTGESVSDPPYVRGKVARPMVQKTAGSGVYYRVNILNERKDTMEIYYPPYEDEPDFREWIWRTSDRIHKATSGKWSYVGRGGWKFNTSSKGRKKRRAAKGAGHVALSLKRASLGLLLSAPLAWYNSVPSSCTLSCHLNTA
jgi:hypothetical protein